MFYVCIKNRHTTEETYTLHSLAYDLCFYKIQSRQNSQVSRPASSQDNKRRSALLWYSRKKSGVTGARPGSITNSLDDQSLPLGGDFSVKHGDSTRKPPQVLPAMCPPASHREFPVSFSSVLQGWSRPSRWAHGKKCPAKAIQKGGEGITSQGQQGSWLHSHHHTGLGTGLGHTPLQELYPAGSSTRDISGPSIGSQRAGHDIGADGKPFMLKLNPRKI